MKKVEGLTASELICKSKKICNKPQSQRDLLYSALLVLQQKPDPICQIKVYYWLGNSYTGNKTQQKKYYIKALDLSRNMLQIKNHKHEWVLKELYALTCIGLGNSKVYFAGNKDNTHWYHKALEVCKNTNIVIKAYKGLANALSYRKHNLEALAYIDKAIALNQNNKDLNKVRKRIINFIDKETTNDAYTLFPQQSEISQYVPHAFFANPKPSSAENEYLRTLK